MKVQRLFPGHYSCWLPDGRFVEIKKDPSNGLKPWAWDLLISAKHHGYFDTLREAKEYIAKEFYLMKILHIHGRRWTSRMGTTYHTVNIWIDGEYAHKSGQHSGYGEHYLQTAKEWLEGNGYLPELEHYNHGGLEPLWQYCNRKGIKFVYYADDFNREKDLLGGY